MQRGANMTKILSYVYSQIAESQWGLLFVLLIILTVVLAVAFPEAQYR
jgi:hypothetical protein